MALLCSIKSCDLTASPALEIFSQRELVDVSRFVDKERGLSIRQGELCKTPLYFGLFFDGTKNNYELNEATKNQLNVARLIDGAFVPGLHKRAGAGKPHMLFDGLPGFNETTRDVSPFVVVFEPSDKKLCSVLEDCSGWPMVSAITTMESATDLTKRLAAWCVVEADGQYLNFRFPDTRRLPDILAILDAEQSAEFTGPATECRYIGKAGEWITATLTSFQAAPSVDPQLDAKQFSALIKCSDGMGSKRAPTCARGN